MSTKHASRLGGWCFMAVLGALLIAALPARADITVLQTSNSVSGHMAGVVPPVGYSDVQSQAASGSFSYSDPSRSTSGTANSLAGTFTAQANASAHGPGLGGLLYATALADAHTSFNFSANDPALTMHFWGRYDDSQWWATSTTGFTLLDLTDNSTVDSWSSPAIPPNASFFALGYFDFTPTWTVDTTHVYQLALDASVVAPDAQTFARIFVSVPIPLPAAAWMALPLLASLPLLRLRRRTA